MLIRDLARTDPYAGRAFRCWWYIRESERQALVLARSLHPIPSPCRLQANG